MELTFDQLPSAVSKLLSKLDEIERLLQLKSSPQQQTDQWFNIDELHDYHPDKPAKPTIYGLVSRGLIPHHKRGKKLYFLKSEIDAWLKEGRKKTTSELQAEAENYMHLQKRKTSRV